MSFFGKLIEKLDDRINPIAVKELRQAVQSRMVIASLSLLLILQTACLAIYLITAGVEEQTRSINFNGGRILFSILQGILLGTCMLLIPAFTGSRLASERSDTNTDLLFTTSLSPQAIVRGKVLAAMVLVLIIFSACAPFMMFTYLLRGVDIPSMALVLFIDFLAVMGGIIFSLFFAAVPGQRGFKVILGLFGFGALCGVFSLAITGTVAIMAEGVLYQIPTTYFWAIIGSMLLLFLMGTGILYFWTVALLSPASSNRALPVRIFTLIAWLSTGIVAIIWGHKESSHIPLMVWMYIQVSILALQFFIAVSERDKWGVRVRRTIPNSRFLRSLAFLFYSGSGGGLIFSLLLTLLTGGIGFYHSETYGRSWDEWRDMDECLHIVWLNLMYAFCFTATAMLIRNVFFRNKFDTYKIPMIAFMLIVFGSVFPYIVAYVFDSNIYSRYGYRDTYWWLLSNPFYSIGEAASARNYYGARFGGSSYSYNEFRDLALLFTACWAGLALMANIPSIVKQWRLFTPLKDDPIVLNESTQDEVMDALPLANELENPQGIQSKPNYE